MRPAVLSLLLLFGCSSTPKDNVEEWPRKDKTEEKTQPREEAKKQDTTSRDDFPTRGGGVDQAKFDTSLKGNGGQGGTRTDTNSTTTGDEVLRLQRERVARDPSSDVEKLRLVLMLVAAGEQYYPEAERFMTMLRQRGEIVPYLEAFLYRKLGETQRASQLHEALIENWRQANGFKIERAELVTSVGGFLRYEPHPDGKLAGGDRAWIYLQPRNFTLKKEGERHTLHLKYDWKLFDDRNQEIVVPDWQNCNPNDRMDVLRYNGPVTEFYQQFRLPLPKNLYTGTYRIQVTVRDQWTGQEDKVYVSFFVVPR